VNADADWFGAKFSVYTDRFGFRCDDSRRFAVEKEETIDLLIVGDSQAYGQGLNFDQSLAGALILQAAGDGVRAANMATGGHYLQNQLELLRWLTEHENLRVKHYLILITPYLLMSPHDRICADVGSDGRLYQGESSFWKQALVQIKTHFVLYSKVRNALRATILPPQTDPRATNTFLSEFESGAAEAQRGEAFLAFMTSFKKWAREHDADAYLVYTPLTLEFEFESLRKAAKERGVTIDSGSPSRIAESVATTVAVPFYDLRSVLKAIYSTGQGMTLRGDPHYNSTVSVAAATKAWEALRPSLQSHHETHSATPAMELKQ
jgi:hypothetical protein